MVDVIITYSRLLNFIIIFHSKRVHLRFTIISFTFITSIGLEQKISLCDHVR